MRFKHSSVMKNSGEHKGHMWKRDAALRLQSEAKSIVNAQLGPGPRCLDPSRGPYHSIGAIPRAL